MELGRPPLQPGAELYQSPFTILFEKPLEDVIASINHVLDSIHAEFDYDSAKYKYKVAICCTTACCDMVIRIWSRVFERESYTVEILRNRGERVAVGKVAEWFQLMSTSNKCVKIDYDDAMFSWPCMSTPPLQQRHKVELDESAGLHANKILHSLTTEYDDVVMEAVTHAKNICVGIQGAKEHYSSSPHLLETLLKILKNDKFSWMTRVNTAQFLRMLDVKLSNVRVTFDDDMTAMQRLIRRFLSTT